MASQLSTALGLLLVVVLYEVQVSVCQDGNRQREHLKLLGNTSNSELVNPCTVLASTFLNCTLKNNPLLMVDSNVALNRISLFICLCGSAWNATYFFTDGTNVTTLCTQCPFQLHRGDLIIHEDIRVFEDRGNETNLGITVQLVHDSSSVTMFNGTVPLSQQVEKCRNNSKGPPDPGECRLPTTQPPTEPTTTSPPATTTSPAGGIGKGTITTVAIVIILFVVVIILFVGLGFTVWYFQRRKKYINLARKKSLQAGSK